MNASAFFERHLPARLSAASAVFALGRTIGFELSGPRGGQWTLVLNERAHCVAKAAPDADCRLALSDDDFEAVLREPQLLKQLFRGGRVRVEGDMSVAMNVPGLLTLLAAPRVPGGIDEFFQDRPAGGFVAGYWPDIFTVAHGPLARIPELIALDQIHSVDDLLAVWPGGLRLGDRFGGREIDTSSARTLYRQGCHLAFSDAEQVFPVLRRMLERLRLDLRLPLNCFGRCPIYASPNGVGEALHFDQNANFIVQISGEKIWRVAPNRDVIRPTDRYTTAQPVPSAELRLYGPDVLPVTLPPDAETVRMKPGSVMFLPRGHWHQTEAVGHSLSLNFTFDQPTWADLMGPGTRRALLGREQWRALASGAAHLDAIAADDAVRTLASLIAALPAQIVDISAAEAIARLTPTEASEVLIPKTDGSPGNPT